MAVRVGVIGAGAMGGAHVRTLAGSVSGADVVAVADADTARAAQVAGAARVYEDGFALIEDDGIDAVLVASSDQTHEGFVLACLAAGKPVLCEKPLATSGPAAERIVAAEAELGRRLVEVGFMRRHDTGYRGIRGALRDGRIGEPLMLHCVHRNPHAPPWFESGMLVTSSLIHELDVARWLLGRELASATVRAPRASRHAQPGLLDPQFILLETDDGVLVDVEVFVNAQYGYEVRCELVGELGTVSLPSPAVPCVRSAGAAGTALAGDYLDRFGDAYRSELQAWVDGVADGALRGPSAWDGYAANAAGDACLAALESGRTEPIALAERPALYEPEGVRPI